MAIMLLAGVAEAQLSPGELATPHAALEGSRNCFQCHRAGKGVDPGLCLTCHTPLRQRVRLGLGLHAQPEYLACETCHIEHHGKNFDLIWWGEGGMEQFDHLLTGYALKGVHGTIACRDCHRSEYIIEPARLRQAEKDLERTFLGLEADCISCHEDEHQGQFESASCDTCHGEESWRPAPLFDHDSTSFPLTGQHRDLACESCHEATETDGPIRYRGIAAESCTDCHQDPHRGRFGNDCQSCHNTEDWQRVDRQGFDHGRTRFPLRGAHRGVDCESCHGENLEFLQIPGFDRCETCHADTHLGQFANHASAGRCDACHGVEEFVPSRFSVEDHRQSRFPLEGAHQQVPCADCHQDVPLEILRPHLPPAAIAGALSLPSSLQQFRFDSMECTDCHRDPHFGETEPYLGSQSCLSCHGVSSWQEVSFDHAQTGWELAGRHAEVACTECHQATEAPAAAPEIRFTRTETSCQSCHDDPHHGQFDRAGAPPSCTDCHGFESWAAEGFDHNRDSEFLLEGAHLKVPCAGCHPLETLNGQAFVRYKPLGQKCSDCHGDMVR